MDNNSKNTITDNAPETQGKVSGRSLQLLGYGLLLLTAFVWGMAFAFQRSGMQYIGPLTFVACRMMLSTLVLIPVIAFLDRRKPREPEPQRSIIRKNTLKGGIMCGILLFAGSYLQQAGLVYTPAGKAGFITALYMLLVPVIGVLFLGKQLPAASWAAVLMGTAGLYMICMSESLRLAPGDVLVMGCALCFAVHIYVCDHYSPISDPVRLSCMQFAVCSLLSWIASIAFELSSGPQGPVFTFAEDTIPMAEGIAAAAVAIIYCGVFSGGVGYTLQIVAQKYTRPSAAALIMSLESVFATLGGALLLHERLSLKEYAGCAVMFAAVVIIQISDQKNC